MHNRKYNLISLTSQRNKMVDIFKFICAFFVIGIHTSVFSDISSKFNFFFTQIVCRVAVPFFIVTTGYFIGKKLTFNNNKVENSENNNYIFKKNIKQIFFLYTIWSLIYLIAHIHNWIEIDWFSVHSFIDWGIAFIRNGSYYHLWYLLAMIYGLIAAYFVLQYIHLQFYPIMIIILYGIETILYVYKAFLPDCFGKIFEIADLFGCIITGCVCILPFVMLGIYISQKDFTKNRKYYFFFILNFAFQIIETFVLKSIGEELYSYIIFTLPVAYFLFQAIHTTKISVNINTRWFAKTSMVLYCVHPFFIYFLKPVMKNNTVLFGVVSILSLVVAFIWIMIQKLYVAKKGN